MRIRRNLVDQYAIICKQFLECLRGELSSIVCTDPLDGRLAMVLGQCNVLIKLLQGFWLGFHAVDPDVLGVIIIASHEVLTATRRSCLDRGPDVSMNQFIRYHGPFCDNMERQMVTLAHDAVFTLCISQGQTRHVLPPLAQQTLDAHPHYFPEIEVTQSVRPVGELVSN
jgi:hypothetical protein